MTLPKFMMLSLCAGVCINHSITASELSRSETNQHLNRKLDSKLTKILAKDDLDGLMCFIDEHPGFDWTSSRRHFIFTTEAATPLIGATWHGAARCLDHLLQNNVGNIRSSVYTRSSHEKIALDYATDRKKQPHLERNAQDIQRMLQKYTPSQQY